MTCDEVRLALQETLGEGSPPAVLAAHVAACGPCQGYHAGLLRTVAVLSAAAARPAEAAPAELLLRLGLTERETEQTPPRPAAVVRLARRQRAAWTWSAIAAVMVAGVGLFGAPPSGSGPLGAISPLPFASSEGASADVGDAHAEAILVWFDPDADPSELDL